MDYYNLVLGASLTAFGILLISVKIIEGDYKKENFNVGVTHVTTACILSIMVGITLIIRSFLQ